MCALGSPLYVQLIFVVLYLTVVIEELKESDFTNWITVYSAC
jgi:hypothetical protein